MGLFGLGGVGKTTLLTQINKKFSNTNHDFDFVIWVVVSKNPVFERIQNDIGKKIGLQGDTWEKKSLNDRAIDIYNFLSKIFFVLLLDDMWERFELSRLGIPLPDSQNKCKVIFTTRSEKVCSNMGPHKKIRVECLSWKNAWNLFRNYVGEETLNSDHEIIRLAQHVAKECGGLPLALITIGRAMACKKMPQEWEYAIHVLKSAIVKFPGMADEVFNRLHFSYQSLPNEAIRLCFLYCSLFPEDYVIDKDDLINKWIGEDFIHDFDGYEEEARNRGYEIIGILLHACLLEDVSKTCVKMHDGIRDMALWVACDYRKLENKFFVARVDMTEAPEVSKWKGVKRMSLMGNKIKTLTKTPACHELSTLLLNRNYELFMIQMGFFQSMNAIKVLDLSNCRISHLPSDIGKLCSLRYLNLESTGIEHLPIEMENLVRLKYLNLRKTTYLVSPPPQVISNLSSLQVLDMFGSGIRVEPMGATTTLIEKLNNLKCLKRLGITIISVSSFQTFSNSLTLQGCCRSLMFKGMESLTTFDVLSLSHVTRLEIAVFDGCWDIEDTVIDHTIVEKMDLVSRSYQFYPNLREVCIFSCNKIKSLTWLIFIPNLKTIRISSCENLEEVIREEKWMEEVGEGKISEQFEKLETLLLSNLPKLKSICATVLLFRLLESLQIIDCQELKKLLLNSKRGEGSSKIVIEGKRNWFDTLELEWEDEATRNTFLPDAHIQDYNYYY